MKSTLRRWIVAARNRPVRSALILFALVAGAAAALVRSDAEGRSLAYTELLQALDGGTVADLTLTPGQGVAGTLRDGTVFTTAYTLSTADDLVARAVAGNVPLRFGPVPVGASGRLATPLGLLVAAALATILFLQLRSQAHVGSVGKVSDQATTTFADVAGTQGAAEDLREVVQFLRQPAAFETLGARVPKGVLLFGPPGTGKTLLARAVAGEAGVPFFHLSGSEVTGFLVGLGAHRIRSLFRRARKRGGVIFIDELDALGGKRGREKGHGEDDRTLNQLLVEMDGFAPREGVVVLAATNRPDDLDAALKRPGRFDRWIAVGLPNAEGREAILRLHAERRRMPLGEDVDLARLARLTPGSSGADLANLLNEAAISAARDGSPEVAWNHFELARDRALLGRERSGFRAREREVRTIATHEAGHALAGVVACPEDGLHKVTVQARGMALGVAHFMPDDDRVLYSRRYLEGQIIKGLGGRVAEEIVFGADNVTGGAENDLVQVNRIARRMVFRLGMGEQGGLLVLDPDNGPLGDEVVARLDREVEQLLTRLMQRTREILTAHRPALEALASALVEQETLDGVEALRILRMHGLAAGGES